MVVARSVQSFAFHGVWESIADFGILVFKDTGLFVEAIL